MTESSMRKVTMEQEYADTKIADSICGCKMIIPLCNASVPAYWTAKAMEVSEVFMHVYDAVYGSMPEGIYVAGSLIACLDRKVPADRKFGLHIVIIVEGSGSRDQDYMIELPILPDDRHFSEARKCFLDEFLKMLGGQA